MFPLLLMIHDDVRITSNYYISCNNHDHVHLGKKLITPEVFDKATLPFDEPDNWFGGKQERIHPLLG